jgi:hypothetical protein
VPDNRKIVLVVSQAQDNARVIFPQKFAAAVAKLYRSRTDYAPVAAARESSDGSKNEVKR